MNDSAEPEEWVPDRILDEYLDKRGTYCFQMEWEQWEGGCLQDAQCLIEDTPNMYVIIACGAQRIVRCLEPASCLA